jgi:hypothetical protein
MKAKYKDKVYTRFIISYVDGEMVKAQLFVDKTEVVVLKSDLNNLTFIYN